MDTETLVYAQKVFLWVQSEDVQALRPLLANRLPAKLLNEKGHSLLMLTIYDGHPEAARLPLVHGADLKIRQWPRAGFGCSCRLQGRSEMVELLPVHGADIEVA